MRELPGTEAAAAVSDLPATGAARVTFLIQGQPEPPANQRPRTLHFVATPGFFRAAGIPLLRGRSFMKEDDAAAPRIVVVNQAFVHRYFISMFATYLPARRASSIDPITALHSE